MPKYHYRAVDQDGKTVSNTMTADSYARARQQLTDSSLVVFELLEVPAKFEQRGASLKKGQKALWVRQLATLLGAGYTLEKALQSCGQQSKDERLRIFNQTIHRRVVEGMPFHKVLSEYPKVFDETFCATVKAGESSGHLDTILERLADYAETSSQMRDSIRQALIYPIILMIVASLLIAYLVTSVIPDVVKVFMSSGQELPVVTQLLLTVSHVIGHYWWLIGAILLILIAGIRQLYKRQSTRLWWHNYQLRIPLIGELISGYHAANFSATLAILLGAGVKLVDALKISTQTLSNMALYQVASKAYEEVQKGKSLAHSLQSEKEVFPGMLLELIDSGEKTGKLSEMLNKSAVIYQQSSQSRLNALTSLLGPVMILIMGGLIFVIVLAILLPIFDLNQVVR